MKEIYRTLEDGRIQCEISRGDCNIFGYGDTEEEALKDCKKNIVELDKEMWN